MEYAKFIGENLKAARKGKGLTQKQVAQQLFMTQQQYSRFENGVYELNYGQIRKLCELLEVTPKNIRIRKRILDSELRAKAAAKIRKGLA